MKKILGIKLGFDELKICLILPVNSFTVFLMRSRHHFVNYLKKIKIGIKLHILFMNLFL